MKNGLWVYGEEGVRTVKVWKEEAALHAASVPRTEAINKALKRSQEREQNVTAIWNWLWY